MFLAPKGQTEFMAATELEEPMTTPKWTENWGLWLVVALLLIAMGYVYPIVDLIQNSPPGSPGYKTW